MEHHFNIIIAEKYGVEGAIIIHNLMFWISKNEANNKHFYDDTYWTYNSLEAFTKQFPYWSRRQIERILNSLEINGAIIKGNYNKSSYDRTTWYALTDMVKCIYANGETHFTKRGNGYPQTVTPIPDSNTYNKQYNKLDIAKTEVFEPTPDKELFNFESDKQPEEEIPKKVAPKKGFKIPTIEEVKAYCIERKNNISAERFVNFYQSKDWMIGKNKMKNWQAAVRTWETPKEQPQKNIDNENNLGRAKRR
jgi:hypothetical protein